MAASGVRALSVCIYCGSRSGTQKSFEKAARDVGRLIGERGWRMVYGGGNAGLMGATANAALSAGAQVVGVIPRSLMQREHGHNGLTELQVVDTMHERKKLMAEQADIFLALPGGIGTFEELFEVWTWRQLGYHDKPLGLLNVDGYYDRLLAFMDDAVTNGFVHAEQRLLLKIDSDPAELLQALSDEAQLAIAPDDYRQI